MNEMTRLMQFYFQHSLGREVYRLGVGIVVIVQPTGTHIGELDCLVVFDTNNWRIAAQIDAKGSKDLVERLHIKIRSLYGVARNDPEDNLLALLGLMLKSQTGQQLFEHPKLLTFVEVKADTAS